MKKIGETLQKILGKKYEPDSLINKTIGRLDIAFKTDESGSPVSVFVGKAGPDGRINGDRFVRVTSKDEAGRVVKDHWEGKGRT